VTTTVIWRGHCGCAREYLSPDAAGAHFGGIYSGLFTANEAAVVACFYAFFVEIFLHRDMKLREVKRVVVSSAVTTATLLDYRRRGDGFWRISNL